VNPDEPSFTIQLKLDLAKDPANLLLVVPYVSYPDGTVDTHLGYSNLNTPILPFTITPTVQGTYHVGVFIYADSATGFGVTQSGTVTYTVTTVNPQVDSINQAFTITAGSFAESVSLPFTYFVPFNTP
jgi:hypothetical protein